MIGVTGPFSWTINVSFNIKQFFSDSYARLLTILSECNVDVVYLLAVVFLIIILNYCSYVVTRFN